MKIALIIDSLLIGGAQRQILLSALELKKLGHTVTLIIYHPYVEFEDFIRENNIDVVEIKHKGILRLARICALSKCLRERHFDVVHAFKDNAAFFASIAAKLAGIELVFGGFRGTHTGGITLDLVRRVTDTVLTGWIVNSKAVADSMTTALRIDPEKFFVVYNGISPGGFVSSLSRPAAKRKFGLSEDHLVVTIMARLDPVKNHRLFLRVASTVLRSRANVAFLIVGDGPLRHALSEEAKSLGISGQVFFLGNRSDVPDVLAGTDVSVLTSESEGFPNALIESMSVGIPVVSTDYPAIKELIIDGKHGFIVPRNDAAALAVKINRLLNDPNLRVWMGQQASTLVQKRFSATTMAKNLVAVYKGDHEKVVASYHAVLSDKT